ncbi:PilZ domain-containing protein [Phenylobacterium montanum]|uniref:PilZ domain-containing protein n=1 Tax=Phenylobacterium montanum TaxID=2823693 RepID=A0A975G1L1_9CAUL|nr:PilZ domain-containing protein [Caulobacter sp. S6]QUD89104.1 PilZ domain-containing protein [Caulobacter sp. S6]
MAPMTLKAKRVEMDPPEYVDRRASPRRKTRFKATIVHGEDLATLPCLVVDLSDSGARIRTEHAGSLPAAFYLIWHAERSVIEAEMIWRSGGELGVRFKGKRSLEGKLTAELAAVYRAWGG